MLERNQCKPRRSLEAHENAILVSGPAVAGLSPPCHLRTLHRRARERIWTQEKRQMNTNADPRGRVCMSGKLHFTEGSLTCRLHDVLQPERVLELRDLIYGNRKTICDQMEGSDEHLQGPCANSKEKTNFFYAGYFLCYCEKDEFPL